MKTKIQSDVEHRAPLAVAEADADATGLHARIEPAWVLRRSTGEMVDSRLLLLLEAVAASGSLQQAAQRLGVSYRHAWELVRPWTAKGGLLRLSRGQGATLTESGLRLVAHAAEARARWTREAPRWHDLELHLSAAHTEKIRLCASHDLLLAELSALAARQGVTLEVVFRSSAEALAELKAAQCDVAGFHAPAEASHPLHRHMMNVIKDIPGVAQQPLFRRTLGLIVERGNPHKIRTLSDLLRHKICFVNRQRGSGTRVLFDALLVDKKIAAADLIGYGHEEFTHAAVAATVASGAAQAGFGNEAAARLFDLSFVPVIEEYYFLAWRERTTALQALLILLNSREWRQRIQTAAGYAPIVMADQEKK